MVGQTLLDSSWNISQVEDFPEFAKAWAASFNQLFSSIRKSIRPKTKEKNIQSKIENFLAETVNTFRLTIGKTSQKPGSLSQFCTGQFRILSSFLDQYTVNDLSEYDEPMLLECVPPPLRLKLALLIDQKLRPFLGSKDPFLVPLRPPPSLSLISIGGKPLKIQDGIVELSAKVVGRKLAHFAEKRSDVLKLSDIAENASLLKDLGVKSFNFTGNFIHDDDIPDIVQMCEAYPSSSVILRNTEVKLSPELSPFRRLVERCSLVDISETPAFSSIRENQSLIALICDFPDKIIWLESHMLSFHWHTCIPDNLQDRVKATHERFYGFAETEPISTPPSEASSSAMPNPKPSVPSFTTVNRGRGRGGGRRRQSRRH